MICRDRGPHYSHPQARNQIAPQHDNRCLPPAPGVLRVPADACSPATRSSMAAAFACAFKTTKRLRMIDEKGQEEFEQPDVLDTAYLQLLDGKSQPELEAGPKASMEDMHAREQLACMQVYFIPRCMRLAHCSCVPCTG